MNSEMQQDAIDEMASEVLDVVYADQVGQEFCAEEAAIALTALSKALAWVIYTSGGGHSVPGALRVVSKAIRGSCVEFAKDDVAGTA